MGTPRCIFRLMEGGKNPRAEPSIRREETYHFNLFVRRNSRNRSRIAFVNSYAST